MLSEVFPLKQTKLVSNLSESPKYQCKKQVKQYPTTREANRSKINSKHKFSQNSIL
jgi:hypothetical protein